MGTTEEDAFHISLFFNFHIKVYSPLDSSMLIIIIVLTQVEIIR